MRPFVVVHHRPDAPRSVLAGEDDIRLVTVMDRDRSLESPPEALDEGFQVCAVGRRRKTSEASVRGEQRRQGVPLLQIDAAAVALLQLHDVQHIAEALPLPIFHLWTPLGFAGALPRACGRFPWKDCTEGTSHDWPILALTPSWCTSDSHTR